MKCLAYGSVILLPLTAVACKTEVKSIKKERKLVPQKLQHIFKQTSDSIDRNCLRINEYHGIITRRSYFVSKIIKQKRLDFAKTNLNNLRHFGTIIYTDESKFNIFLSDGRSYVWRKKNTALEKNTFRPTLKHNRGRVLIWRCTSSAGADGH